MGIFRRPGGDGSYRVPVVGIVLFVAVGVGIAAFVVDAVVSATRSVVSVATAPEPPGEPELDLSAFDDHPFLAGLPVPRTECALPAFGHDPATVTAYYAAVVDCLNAVWRPVLLAAGFEPVPPAAVFSTGDGTSECGTPAETQATAWYCGADGAMYLPPERLTAGDSGRVDQHLVVIAHEYGHHVQAVAGLAELAWGGSWPDRQAEYRISRRYELQADCLAGLFVGAVAGRGSVPAHVASGAPDTVGGGSVDTHGSLLNSSRWIGRGVRGDTTAACDTWSAPEEEVSYR
ncbi:MAG TPA: neutral zinc metallopeptidase [Pseudonocardiaceae bacterium]